jgi:hypothetical protein
VLPMSTASSMARMIRGRLAGLAHVARTTAIHAGRTRRAAKALRPADRAGLVRRIGPWQHGHSYGGAQGRRRTACARGLCSQQQWPAYEPAQGPPYAPDDSTEHERKREGVRARGRSGPCRPNRPRPCTPRIGRSSRTVRSGLDPPPRARLSRPVHRGPVDAGSGARGRRAPRAPTGPTPPTGPAPAPPGEFDATPDGC